MKFYGENTKQLYNTQEECEKAEKDYLDRQTSKNERRKECAKNVDVKREAYIKAAAEYKEALNTFCKEFGAYHYTLDNKSLSDWLDLWF